MRPASAPWGAPFVGFDGHHKPREVPRTHMQKDSRDWMFNHADGSTYARDGYIEGPNPNPGVGLLDGLQATWDLPGTGYSPRVARVLPFVAGSFTPNIDGETYAVLITEEDETTASPYLGTVAYYNPTAGAGGPSIEFPASYLIGTAANYPSYAKLCPWIAGPRATDPAASANVEEGIALAAKGSRDVLDTKEWMFLPNGRHIPAKWNKAWSAAARPQSPVDRERLFPWGHIPPMQPPLVSANGSTADTSGSWLGSELFYCSVLFKHRDGSLSMPFTPRPPLQAAGAAPIWPLQPGTVVNPWGLGATYPGGFGLVAVNSASPTTRYRAMSVRSLPIGEADVVERWYLRSPKVDTALGAYLLPDPADLRLVEIIPNNTQTAYEDYKGDDNELEELPDLIRWDHIWPPAARSVFTFDQRVAVGNATENPCAVLIAPALCTNPTQAEHTNDVTAATGVTYEYFIEKNSTAIILYRKTIAGPVWAEVRLENLTQATLQDLVDCINTNGLPTDIAVGPPWRGRIPSVLNGSAPASVVDWTATIGRWRAALVPGADPTRLCSTLDNTTGLDFRDGSTARMRVYANSWPGILKFTPADTDPKYTDYLFFTGGGPGHAPNAAQNFYVENFRNPPKLVGEFVAGGALVDGAIALYTGGVGLLRNTRDGKTGVDSDYRLELMNDVRGCISPWSVVRGNGYVGYLTAEGYIINDGRTERCITNDLYDPGRESGLLAYEIAQSMIAAVNNSGYASRFTASLVESWLLVSFRSSAAAHVADLTLVYDFSQGVKRAEPTGVFVGADALFRDDGVTPWGWSTGCRFGVGQTGAATIGGARKIFGAVDGGYGGAYIGVYELFTGNTDRRPLAPTMAFTPIGDTTLTPTTQADIDLAVLAVVGDAISGAGIGAGRSITAVDRTTGVWTINPGTTGTSAGTAVTTTMRHVAPTGTSRLDDWGAASATKHLKDLLVVYEALDAAAGTLAVLVTRQPDGTGFARVSLDATGANEGYTREQAKVPLAVRAPGDAHQLKLVSIEIGDDRATVWGVEKRGAILDPPR